MGHITVCDLLPCPQALSVQLIYLLNQPNPQTKLHLSACICSFLWKEASLPADGVKILAVCQCGPYPTCESLKVPPPSPPRLFVCLRAGNTFFIILFSELRTAPITEYTFHNLKISKYLMTEYLRKGLGWDTEVKRVDWRPAERVTSICLYLTQVTHIHISSLFFSVCLCLCRL